MAPHNPASGTVYKGVNRVSLAMSGYDDPRWMTLKQANDQGMRILPGSKSSPVVYYQFTKEQDRRDENGKPVLGEDGKPLQQTVELERPIMRFARVFNGEQIDGMPPLRLTETAYEWNPIEKAESILAASGAIIKHDQSNRAFYRLNTDSIHLPPRENFEDAGRYYGTALHELGHWTGHDSRMNREHGPFGSEVYAREELRAEIASWMLGQDTGIPHDPEQHTAYVQSWIKALEQDPYEIQRACRDAEQIKVYLLDLERKKELGQENRPDRPLPEREEGIAAMGLPPSAREKTWLNVPYKEKDEAKALGAKWDKREKRWFAPEGSDLSQLQPWLPVEVLRPLPPPLSPQDEFALVLQKAGLDLQGQSPLMDGEIHRVPLVGGKENELNGAYSAYADDPAGWAQNFATGEKISWIATGHVLNEEQIAAIYQERAQARQELETLQAERRNEVARDAADIILGLGIASKEHPYLKEREIEPFGAHQEQDRLFISMHNAAGEIRNLQIIEKDGNTHIPTGGEREGLFHLIASPENNLSQGEIILSENFISGASIHMATGKAVAVAFTPENLTPVAQTLREQFPQAEITICASNNQYEKTDGTVHNRGVIEAERAAEAVGGKVIVPEFMDNEKVLGLTDFNDLHVSRGLEEVKRQIDSLDLENSRQAENTQDKGLERGLSL
jgi:antirestriction protein ArdC/phage/plasmid primase-like uncharacterized protein